MPYSLHAVLTACLGRHVLTTIHIIVQLHHLLPPASDSFFLSYCCVMILLPSVRYCCPTTPHPSSGSMPRTMEVICRNEVVEMAKAGDKVVFAGTVAVVPDTTGMATIGDSTQGKSSSYPLLIYPYYHPMIYQCQCHTSLLSSSLSLFASLFSPHPGSRGSGRRGEGGGDGVGGLKKLGVKEFTYKLIFVACSVQHTDARTGGSVSGNGLAMCCMGVTGDSTASSSGEMLPLDTSPIASYPLTSTPSNPTLYPHSIVPTHY